MKNIVHGCKDKYFFIICKVLRLFFGGTCKTLCFSFNKNPKNPFFGLAALSEPYVLSVMSLSLRASF